MTRLPNTRPIWCVQHITGTGPVTTQHDTHQAASNQWRHLTESRVAAVMYLGAVVIDRPGNGVAA